MARRWRWVALVAVIASLALLAVTIRSPCAEYSFLRGHRPISSFSAFGIHIHKYQFEGDFASVREDAGRELAERGIFENGLKGWTTPDGGEVSVVANDVRISVSDTGIAFEYTPAIKPNTVTVIITQPLNPR